MPPGRWTAQKPWGRETTPGRVPSPTRARISPEPRSLKARTRSPSRMPRPAASSAWIWRRGSPSAFRWRGSPPWLELLKWSVDFVVSRAVQIAWSQLAVAGPQHRVVYPSAAGLTLPGPVLGMVLLVTALAVSERMVKLMRPLAEGILSHLSLLFVPAGVGVVGHVATLGSQALALLAAVVLSTVLAIAAGALAFVAVARLTGSADD